MATRDDKKTQTTDTAQIGDESSKRKRATGSDDPKEEKPYKAPRSGCRYEEEEVRILVHDAKKLGLDVRPYVTWTDSHGVEHDGTTSSSSDDSDCPRLHLIEVPRKFLIELGRDPPPTAEQLADMPEPTAKKARGK